MRGWGSWTWVARHRPPRSTRRCTKRTRGGAGRTRPLDVASTKVPPPDRDGSRPDAAHPGFESAPTPIDAPRLAAPEAIDAEGAQTLSSSIRATLHIDPGMHRPTAGTNSGHAATREGGRHALGSLVRTDPSPGIGCRTGRGPWGEGDRPFRRQGREVHGTRRQGARDGARGRWLQDRRGDQGGRQEATETTFHVVIPQALGRLGEEEDLDAQAGDRLSPPKTF